MTMSLDVNTKRKYLKFPYGTSPSINVFIISNHRLSKLINNNPLETYGWLGKFVSHFPIIRRFIQ